MAEGWVTVRVLRFGSLDISFQRYSEVLLLYLKVCCFFLSATRAHSSKRIIKFACIRDGKPQPQPSGNSISAINIYLIIPHSVGFN